MFQSLRQLIIYFLYHDWTGSSDIIYYHYTQKWHYYNWLSPPTYTGNHKIMTNLKHWSQHCYKSMLHTWKFRPSSLWFGVNIEIFLYFYARLLPFWCILHKILIFPPILWDSVLVVRYFLQGNRYYVLVCNFLMNRFSLLQNRVWDEPVHYGRPGRRYVDHVVSVVGV